MGKIILLISILFTLIVGAVKAEEVCFLQEGVCPLGSTYRGTTFLNGRIYTICCVNSY